MRGLFGLLAALFAAIAALCASPGAALAQQI